MRQARHAISAWIHRTGHIPWVFPTGLGGRVTEHTGQRDAGLYLRAISVRYKQRGGVLTKMPAADLRALTSYLSEVDHGPPHEDSTQWYLEHTNHE